MIYVDRKDYTWRIVDTELDSNELFTKSRINIDEYLVKHASIAITNRCNLSCEYCYKSVKYDGCVKEIPFDVIKGFINDITEVNVKGNKIETIQLIGGEPTLHKDFYKICRLVIDKGLGLRISTNGTTSKILCSSEMEKIYKSGDLEFRISLDETLENEYKSVRNGSGKIVCQNIAYLIGHGANLSVKSVITKENIDDVPTILGYLYSIGVKNFSYSSLYNLGGAGNKKFYDSNYISDLTIYKKFLKVCSEHPEYAPMLKANVIFHMLTNIFIKFPPYFFTKFYLYANYDGNIYAQDQLIFDKFKIGNIYEYDNIGSIIEKLKDMKVQYELEKRSCLECFAYPYCTKGNYGELYLSDKSMESYFPTCSDIKGLVEYIITNNEESLNYLKMIFAMR